MKVLFVGYHNLNFMSLCEYIERAIVDMGYELQSFNYRQWSIPGRIRDFSPYLQNWDIKRINQRLIQKAKSFKPDVMLVTGGWTIQPETVSFIKNELGVITVNWIADFPLKFNEYLKAGPQYNYFFASGTEALARYKNEGNLNGHWLPFACDEKIHRPVILTDLERKKYGCDICFIGSNYSERVEILEKLADFNLGIWGVGWDKLPKDSLLRKCIRGGVLGPEEWVKIYNASKIGLNIIGHRCNVVEPYIEEKEFRMTNTKVFEILSCGTFQLVDAKVDARTIFEGKECLSFYENSEDCVDQVRYFLTHEEERKKIAQNGLREVKKYHTYRHRLEKTFSLIGQGRAEGVYGHS